MVSGQTQLELCICHCLLILSQCSNTVGIIIIVLSTFVPRLLFRELDIICLCIHVINVGWGVFEVSNKHLFAFENSSSDSKLFL